MRSSIPLAALSLTLAACAGRPPAAPDTAPTITRLADADWQPLNPARGDASPRAANIWGDRTQSGPTGFLVRFADGFSSPPHIHNVTYRGVVLDGRVHNDDAAAESMWMPPGSYWTQPAGDAHITAAQGDTLAYIEIDDGPYLVRPVADAFDNGETPINVRADAIEWRDTDAAPAQRAPLWRTADAAPSELIALPTGAATTVRSARGPLRAVVVAGQPTADASAPPLAPGDTLSAPAALDLTCSGETTCLLYITAPAPITLAPRP